MRGNVVDLAVGVVICPNDPKITLPTKDATLDQYREQGVGREYFSCWFVARMAPDTTSHHPMLVCHLRRVLGPLRSEYVEV